MSILHILTLTKISRRKFPDENLPPPASPSLPDDVTMHLQPSQPEEQREMIAGQDDTDSVPLQPNVTGVLSTAWTEQYTTIHFINKSIK